MKKAGLRRIVKITGGVLLILFISALIAAYRFISPKSDQQILRAFEDGQQQPHIDRLSFQGREVRLIKMQAVDDKELPTIVFIHGSPGSSMDFKRYLKDEDLNAQANLIAYDRIGYSDRDAGDILPSLELEVELLHEILKDQNNKNTIVVGYSYGGTVMMASPLDFKRKIALAAAVRGDLEPMFWALNLCRWDLTRPLVPKVLLAAAEEKFRHVEELKAYQSRWSGSTSEVVSVHGTSDAIVPYQNSLYLADVLGERFALVTLEEGNHALLWTHFETIRDLLLKSLKK